MLSLGKDHLWLTPVTRAETNCQEETGGEKYQGGAVEEDQGNKGEEEVAERRT